MLTQFSSGNDKTSAVRKKTIQITLGIAGLILVVDCGLLLANRVFHIGTLVPLGIGLIFLGHAVYWERIQLYLASQPSLKKLWQLVWLLFFVWLISFCVFVSYLKQHFNTDNHPKAAQAIIVLGGGTKDNKPTDAVKLRLDKASEVIKRFTNALVITSGGFDAGGMSVKPKRWRTIYMTPMASAWHILRLKNKAPVPSLTLSIVKRF